MFPDNLSMTTTRRAEGLVATIIGTVREAVIKSRESGERVIDLQLAEINRDAVVHRLFLCTRINRTRIVLENFVRAMRKYARIADSSVSDIQFTRVERDSRNEGLDRGLIIDSRDAIGASARFLASGCVARRVRRRSLPPCPEYYEASDIVRRGIYRTTMTTARNRVARDGRARADSDAKQRIVSRLRKGVLQETPARFRDSDP